MNRIILSALFYCMGSILLQAQTPRPVVPIGHTNGVASVAFSPDGKTVLTGSWDNTAKLWDLSGRELQTFSGHAAGVISVVFSPDGKQVVTGCDDSTVKLWDLSGIELTSFSGDDGPVGSVAFSPNGKQVLIGFEDATPKLWDLSSLELQDFIGHADAVRSVAFSPVCPADPGGGKQVLTSSDDNTAKLWDLSGRELQTFSGHAAAVNSAAFSPDGQQVLTGSDDKTAKLWDLSGRELHTFTGHATGILSVAFTPDGKRILTVSGDNMGTLWDLSGRELQTFTCPPSEGKVVFSPNGKQILTGSSSGIDDYTAKLSDLSGREVQTFKGHATGMLSVAFSPDGKRILTGSGDHTAKLWDLLGRELQTISGPASERPVVFSPDGKQVLTTSGDGTAKLCDLSGRELQTFKAKDIHSMAFSPDGKTVQTHSVSGILKLWDLSGKELKTFSDPDEWIDSIVAFSPDRKQVLAGYGVRAMLWDLSGQELQDFIGHGGDVHSVAFSPDGKTVLTGSSDGTSKLWDLSGQELQDFVGHAAAVRSVAFSPACSTDPGGGKYVLTSSDDLTAKVWDTQTGKLLATLIAIGSNDWAVTTPSGLFDASDGAKKLMYNVVDYEDEKLVLGLDQLQERYWQPGLLGAIMGLTPYPVRDVGVFDHIRLFPSIEDSTRIESDQLHIKLRERNGGIGKLSLRINGRRVEEDLNPAREKEFIKDLKPYARYFRSDTLNILELEVYESQNYLKSEAFKLYYQASVKKRGEGEDEEESLANNCLSPRHLFLIVAGTSLYPPGVDSLPSANEDAVEMARVLYATGAQLYDKRVHLKLLSTKAGETPSKANIAAAFKSYQDSASVCDVLVVFFAGHGSNWGKDGDKSNFYYLTKDITFGKLNDEGIRKAFAISDQELTEWMTKIPAQNQLLILDACNSGQAAINMGGIVARDIDPDKIVAFNLMSGNTGSYVISGSSASGASFESAVFGHGLLTYSLLEGINGTALEGSKVDVLPLLLKSYKRVGELAQSLGEEQTPIIAKPRGNASFFVGKNDGSVKIELAETKPMVIRSFLFDQDKYSDGLDLTEAINKVFRSKEIKGKQAPWFYSDIPKSPQGFSIRGVYAMNKDNTVTVRGSLLKGEDPVGEPFTVVGTKDASVLADLILKAVKPGIRVK